MVYFISEHVRRPCSPLTRHSSVSSTTRASKTDRTCWQSSPRLRTCSRIRSPPCNSCESAGLVQSTPVISRLLGAKICERELSGSPVISHFRAKATTRDLQGHRPTYMTYSGVYKSQTVCWAIIEVLTFTWSLHTSTSHQRQITTSNIRF